MADAPLKKPRPTHITEVSFGMTVNVGNYENVRYDLTAQVADDEDWRDVLDALKRRCERLKDVIQTERENR